MTPIERPERPRPKSSANEADTLWSMLDYYRETLVVKCSELSDDDLRRPSVAPSTLTLLGLLRHMSDVELYWFGYVFAGAEVEYEYDPEMIGADFDDLAGSTGDEVIASFRRSLEWARQWTKDQGLDELARRVRTDAVAQVNLRFIVVHLIEEYARHCGHADLLREAIDGDTGD